MRRPIRSSDGGLIVTASTSAVHRDAVGREYDFKSFPRYFAKSLIRMSSQR
jgi:hypothetical protein